MQTIKSKGLAASSLYKILFIGLLVPIFILTVFLGFASLFGYSTITFNGAYVYGVKGLVVGLVLGVVLPVFMAAFLWCLIAFGIWLWTRMRSIQLTIKNDD